MHNSTIESGVFSHPISEACKLATVIHDNVLTKTSILEAKGGNKNWCFGQKSFSGVSYHGMA